MNVRTLPALACATLALACTTTRSITQTGPGTYRISCKAPLAECLEQLERVCRDGFELENARELRTRAGVDAIGTGVEQRETSEAKVVCLSSALFGESRLVRPAGCTPGETQACVGPGGCAGGQACLPDGRGYGGCDCATPSRASPSGPEPLPPVESPAAPATAAAPAEPPAPPPSVATETTAAPAPTRVPPAPSSTAAPAPAP